MFIAPIEVRYGWCACAEVLELVLGVLVVVRSLWHGSTATYYYCAPGTCCFAYLLCFAPINSGCFRCLKIKVGDFQLEILQIRLENRVLLKKMLILIPALLLLFSLSQLQQER